ncbi:hypothetical protein LTR95_013711 [Oleoguttula sp. CCFEE 5521]
MPRVNWRKFEILGEMVDTPYRGLVDGKGEPTIKELLLEGMPEKDEDALFTRSQQVEPSADTGGTSEKSKEFFKR